MTQSTLIESRRGSDILTFDESTHTYFLNGSPVYGVTTIGKEGYPVSPSLISWMIGEGSKYCVAQIQDAIKDKKKLTKKLLAEFVKSSKAAYRKVARQSADIGTIVHDYAYSIENAVPFDMKRIDDHKDQKKIKSCINKFLQWKSTNIDEIISCEDIVGSTKYRYAGKFDRLAKRDGKTVLSDFKTSSAIYPGYFIQLAGYAIALKEWQNIDVDVFEVIKFGKYDDSFETKAICEPHLIQEFKDQFVRNIETMGFRNKWEKSK